MFVRFDVFMARPSKIRTNIARLRLALSQNQSQFAKFLQRSIASVQSLELGRLKLSEQLAAEIATRTGVNARWLLENDLEAEPFDLTGKPWTPAMLDKLRDEMPDHIKQDDEVFRQRMLELATHLSVARNLAGIRRVYRGMERGSQVVELGRRIDQFLAALMREHSLNPDTNMMEEIRYAEREAERKTQNVLRVAGVPQRQVRAF